MNFTSPSFLWMLAALAPLIAAYFLKVRPRRFPVNALFLWEKIFQEKKASSLFQRLRDAISLLMLALALGAIALAAAGPRPASQDKRDLLIVIDTSPSMRAKTTAGGKDGLETAKERARDIVRALNGTRRAALATASGELDFLSHASDSPKDLTDAIARLQVADVPVGPQTVAALNSCAKGAGSAGRVLLITDGNRGWEGLDPGVEIMRLAPSSVNAGFIAADLDRKPGTTRGAVFFYRIASSVKQETSAELELRHDEMGLARLVPVTLKPGEETSDTLDIDDATAGKWTAELKFPDALATDNVVALGLAEPKPVTVKVVAPQPTFFQRCVEAFSLTGGMLSLVEKDADVTIAQGSATNDPRQIIFAPTGESPFWSGGAGAIEVLAAESKIPGHPVTKHLDLEAMRFEGARDLTPVAGALILATSEAGKPLMWKARVEGRDALVVNLDPAQGEFFFSPAFPALVHGAALDLSGRGPVLRSAHPTGSRVNAGGPVTKPDGNPIPEGDFTVAKLGHYLATTTAGPRWFGGALFERAETVLDGTGPADSGASVERGYPISFWLLLLAIAMLVVEFLLYHRRKAG
ncbi:MAG TPA: VWA domain-containing protein [Haloferula sp.]